MNKLGSYISTLMTVILDQEQDEFVRNLAFDELKRLNVNIEEFLNNNGKDDEKASEITVKQLLQEEKENVKDK